MKAEEKSILQDALDIIRTQEKVIAEVVEKSILVIIDTDDMTSEELLFENKESFFERFEGDEQDCEGFSWELWNNKVYNRVESNGCYYHLIKLFEV